MIDTGYRPAGVTNEARGGRDDDGDAWHIEVEAEHDSAPRIEPNDYHVRIVHGTTKMLFKKKRLG